MPVNYRKNKVKWLGPAETCDICHNSLKHEPYFIDGATKMGPWALMCPKCFKEHGICLGTGTGQMYNARSKNKMMG